MPAATPVTMPVVPTVAIDVLPLVQVPPVVLSLREVVAPVQTVAVPEIDAGVAALPIVTNNLAWAVPQVLVTL